MASTTFATELSDHGLAVRVSMTALAGWNQAMLRMTEGTGLVGVSGFAGHKSIIDFSMAAATNCLWFCWGKGNVQRFMRVGVAAQTIFVLEVGTVTFLIVALKARRYLAMGIMAGCAGDLGVMFGVSLGQDLIDFGVARVFVAVAAVFFWSVLSVSNYHWLVRSSMAGQTNLWLNPNQVEWSSAFLAMTAQTTRNETVFGVTFVAGHVRVFTREVSQLLWRTTVAFRAQICLNARQIERCVSIGMAVMAGLGFFLVAMGVSVTIDTFG